MLLTLLKDGRRRRLQDWFRGRATGFTMVETAVAVMIGGITFAAVYASFTFGYGQVKLAREDLRATQILLSRMENVRLSAYTNIQSTNIIAYYNPAGLTNGSGAGTIYNVTVAAANPTTADLPGLVQYTNSLLRITATAIWTNGHVVRCRCMQTYVATNGLQAYICKRH